MRLIVVSNVRNCWTEVCEVDFQWFHSSNWWKTEWRFWIRKSMGILDFLWNTNALSDGQENNGWPAERKTSRDAQFSRNKGGLCKRTQIQATNALPTNLTCPKLNGEQFLIKNWKLVRFHTGQTIYCGGAEAHSGHPILGSVTNGRRGVIRWHSMLYRRHG